MSSAIKIFFRFLFFIGCAGFLFAAQHIYAQDFNEQILRLTKLKPTDTAYVNASNSIALSLLQRASYDSAFNYIRGSLSAAEHQDYPLGYARAKYLAGKWYIARSDYAKGLGWILQAQQLYESLHYKNAIASCLMQIGVVYYRQKDFASAKTYFNNANHAFSEVNDSMDAATCEYLAALCLTELGDFRTAERDLLDAGKRKEQLNEHRGFYECQMGLAALYLKIGELEKAKHYYNSALSFFTRENNTSGITVADYGLGNVYHALKMNDSAKIYFLKSYELSKRTEYYPSLQNSAKALSEVYDEENNYQQALFYQTQYYAVRDSIFSQEKAQAIANLQFDLNLTRKQSQIDLLSKQRQIDKVFRYVLIGGIILLLVTAFMSFQRYRFKQEANQKLTKANEDVNAALENLKATQEQLVQHEKMASLGILTAGIAHEINNPINFVSASVNPLKRNLNDLISAMKQSGITENAELNFTVDETLKLIAGIDQGSKRTSEIVKGLRNFSRLDEGEMKMSNLHEGIESSLLLLNNKLDQKHIEVIKLYGNIPDLKCYPGQLNQVFMNLLTNAIDAIGSDGKIFITTDTVSSGNHSRSVHISIRDTGMGMNDEVKKKLFDPFFTTKDVGKGTGLGLSISYGIIEKHNGKIEVKSKEGGGTEFNILLPVSS